MPLNRLLITNCDSWKNKMTTTIRKKRSEYVFTFTCPLCGHFEKQSYTSYTTGRLLKENFTPCKKVLCVKCHQWFTLSKHTRLCGKYSERCFECLFDGAAVIHFKKNILPDFSYTVNFMTSDWSSSSATSSTYSTTNWFHTDSSSTTSY